MRTTRVPDYLPPAQEVIAGFASGGAKGHDGRMAESENLQIEVLRAGNGPVPGTGQVVSVHYTGWLTDGTKFDSSVDRNEPFEFVVGQGQVIAGWDMALLRMRVGDQVRVTLPPHLAYGDSGAGGMIPPKAQLIFQIELLAIRG